MMSYSPTLTATCSGFGAVVCMPPGTPPDDGDMLASLDVVAPVVLCCQSASLHSCKPGQQQYPECPIHQLFRDHLTCGAGWSSGD
jgi:hypothetical protein